MKYIFSLMLLGTSFFTYCANTMVPMEFGNIRIDTVDYCDGKLKVEGVFKGFILDDPFDAEMELTESSGRSSYVMSVNRLEKSLVPFIFGDRRPIRRVGGSLEPVQKIAEKNPNCTYIDVILYRLIMQMKNQKKGYFGDKEE